MAFYDDTDFDYQAYWQNREYEHLSEVEAIQKLLRNNHFVNTVDIGGGYGRLTDTVSKYTKNIVLLEPSAKLRQIAKKKFKTCTGIAQKTNLPDASQDLVTCFRVLHHISNLEKVFTEFARILKPGGTLLIEFANSAHIKAQLKAGLSGQAILRTPVDIRSATNIRNKTIPFVNHHPETINKILETHNFAIDKILSVSNFRAEIFKKLIPLNILLGLESAVQEPLARLYFGPSIFVMAHRI